VGIPKALSDRKFGLITLVLIFVFALCFGITLAWQSHTSGIATPI
jgi:hypothetical protein